MLRFTVLIKYGYKKRVYLLFKEVINFFHIPIHCGRHKLFNWNEIYFQRILETIYEGRNNIRKIF